MARSAPLIRKMQLRTGVVSPGLVPLLGRPGKCGLWRLSPREPAIVTASSFVAGHPMSVMTLP